MKKMKTMIIGIFIGVVVGVLVACSSATAENKDGEYLDYCGKHSMGSMNSDILVYEDKHHGKVIYLYAGQIAVEDMDNRRDSK